MSACIFCRIINKEVPAYIIFENKEFLAVLDRNPINPGHILLMPKKHVEYLFELDNEAYNKLLLKAKDIAIMMKEKTKAKKTALAVEGFGVPHIHIHLVPVNSGNELNPEKAKTATDEELKNVKENIYNIKNNK